MQYCHWRMLVQDHRKTPVSEEAEVEEVVLGEATGWTDIWVILREQGAFWPGLH